ncbi:nucleotide pyrophosphohydrolase [Nocardioides nitrophenolicus]|uniref:nucleotide pyrophosphohydrolase n=1 Tax=Nocardioides nitrophenolicus TaxID=60489 RepID=UPI00195734E9|nr:nucleotide pyrophosphohydrolase [Nocardioides nitrophenolicus]MBM7519512.1 NTP pyrophosphatase (non-canonical NTP hydrolase) [Nocardioides nitrophenolicus]
MGEDLDRLRESLEAFRTERDWQKFHDVKNLAMALSGEVGEICSLLQWTHSSDLEEWLADEQNHARLADEIGDTLAYLLYLAEAAQVDLVAACANKLAKNRNRYPTDLARGRSTKYSDLIREKPSPARGEAL